MSEGKFMMTLPEEVSFVLERLSGAGYSAYCVGGCVRDALMGKTPHDYDVTTSARPDEMLRVFGDQRVVETGLKHGTITVVKNSKNIEITTYRIDGEYGDCRHPKEVTFTDRLSDDLCRRDFTVNAMAYSPDDGLVDLYGGREDIENGIIRCVGRARDRFSEDGLRILRALRFSSVLRFTPDDECARAVAELTPLLGKISRERIHTEMTKLLTGSGCTRVLDKFPETVAFALGIPAEDVVRAAACISRDTGDADPLMRYALLLDGRSREEGAAVIDSLKPSREEKRTILSYLDHRRSPLDSEYAVLRLIASHGDGFPPSAARCKLLLGLIGEDEYNRVCAVCERVIREDRCRSLGDLCVNGTDLSALGLKGREIGSTLDALLDAVLRGNVANEKTALIALAEETASKYSES